VKTLFPMAHASRSCKSSCRSQPTQILRGHNLSQRFHRSFGPQETRSSGWQSL